MPEPIQKWLCSTCKSEYYEYNDAVQCECLPLPTPIDIEVGQLITFGNEDSFFGTRYSYSTASGEVLLKYVTLMRNRDNGNTYHSWAFIVRDSSMPRECLCAFIPDEFGMVNLTSLAEWKYDLGHADFLRNKVTCL